jgi:hypothetical protein
LKFVDGTEKTYDASELEFIKDEYADGGELEWGDDLGDGFSVGNDVIITASGKTGYISGLSGKDLLVTISEDGEDMSVVVSKSKVKMLDAPEYAKGGKIQKRPRFDDLMADGGVTYVAPNDYDQKYFRRFDKAIGSFAWIYNKKYNEGILYPLTDFDKDYYSHIKLKDGEVLLRYKTDRMMSKYLIKFNLDKSLIYFLVDGDDDKNPTFESRGIKADYIVVTNNYKK